MAPIWRTRRLESEDPASSGARSKRLPLMKSFGKDAMLVFEVHVSDVAQDAMKTVRSL